MEVIKKLQMQQNAHSHFPHKRLKTGRMFM
jgi:hypothetical protein